MANSNRRIDRHSRHVFEVVTLAGLGLLVVSCSPSPSILDPHGPSAARIASLSWALFAAAALVFILVVGLLCFAIFRRRAAEAAPLADDRRTLMLVIIAGGVIPVIVLAILMGLGIYTEQALAAPPGDPQYTISIIGHQWWWEVHYPKEGITTANEVHIPVGEPVYIKLTSADVIHSFWVPELKEKQDAITGQTNTIWMQADQPGQYWGECAEYCGLEHARMNILIVADKPDDFAAWLRAQEQTPAPPMTDSQRAGQQVFLGSACVYCHTVAGSNASGKLGPDLTHLASRRMLGAGILTNTRGNLAGWIVNSQALKPGNKMPPMYVNADELQSLLDYLESLK